MPDDEERIALFLDYENLAIGAREALGAELFDFRPIADALAERGRVVVRRAYADWSRFDDDRRSLTRNHVELIEMPQRMGMVRKNTADIKMAVDAIELCFERSYITTFVLGTGDSDFTPLVHKLRELNRRVIGIGIEASTSALLPPACDEFLFYERLEGVDVSRPKPRRSTSRSSRARKATTNREPAPSEEEEDKPAAPAEEPDLGVLVTQTLAGLERSSGGPVLASTLKRTILRKDPTFSETNYGFRGFVELLRHLEQRGVIELSPGPVKGDPQVTFPAETSDEKTAFALLRSVVERLTAKSGPPHLSGLKNQLRKVTPDFSEKRFGYGGFLQFCKAGRARGVIEMDWDADDD
ncbi:MAG TPA: NYN domain-containing protein, partial [Acidimicrobiia bacterium]|nr:NYN domain-containing protein [Acidimicrobiia bacterium]